MRITLDRVALRALVDADPEFELELKAAVLSEIARRFFEKDSKRIIAEIEPQLFAAAVKAMQGEADIAGLVAKALGEKLVEREPGYYAKMRVKPEVAAELKKLTDNAVAVVTANGAAMVEKAFNDLVVAKIEERLAATDLEERVEKRVARLMDAEIDRRAQAKFEERMTHLREVLR